MHQVLVQPLAVGTSRGQAVLDLVVAHDAALGCVDQEHAPGLQAALLDHRALGNFDHAGLRRHDHQTVAGDHVARGTQPVAVENRADHCPVGERDRGRAVPRLHPGGVVLVERFALGAHLGVMLPGLGDHHQDGLSHRVAAQRQEFEHLVEAGGVAGAGRADGEGPLQALQRRRGQQRLPGPHPVAVAGDGVDLAVVGDHAVGVGQRPRREGVGGEAGVDQRQRALDPLVAQIGVERRELAGHQHPLVDQRPGAEAREVDAGVGRRRAAHGRVVVLGRLVAGAPRSDLVLDALAHDVDPPVQIEAREVVAGDEHLTEAGYRGPRARAQDGGVDGDVPPTDHLEALGPHDALHLRRRLLGVVVGGRQEPDAGGVMARGRELVVDHVAQEPVRYLDQDAGAVAGERVGAQCPPVLEIAQGPHAQSHHAVGGLPADVAHEADAAGVVLVLRVVEALGLCGVGSHRSPRGRLDRRWQRFSGRTGVPEPRLARRREGRHWPLTARNASRQPTGQLPRTVKPGARPDQRWATRVRSLAR